MNAALNRLLAGLFCLVTAACASVAPSTMFIGNRVSSPVVALQQRSSADSWQTFDIKIDFAGTLSGDRYAISGTAELGQHYQMNYANLRDLRVFLFFVDDRTRVLAATLLARSLTGDIDEALPFNRSLAVPAGTAGITFGYDGQVREMEASTSFYLLPLAR